MRETCKGKEVGVPSDRVIVHCPGCPAERAADVQGWRIVRETVVELPNGEKRLGYTSVPDWPTFASFDDAIAHITTNNLPLGWVAQQVARPDVQPGGLAPEGIEPHDCASFTSAAAAAFGDALVKIADLSAELTALRIRQPPDADLVEARAVHAKMTPGPWFNVENDLIGGRCVRTTDRKPSWDNGPEESAQTVFDLGMRDEDFAGIVYFVNRIPGYLDEIERLRRQGADVQKLWADFDWTGCFTDECPHDDRGDCAESIIATVKQFHSALGDLLLAGVTGPDAHGLGIVERLGVHFESCGECNSCLLEADPVLHADLGANLNRIPVAADVHGEAWQPVLRELVQAMRDYEMDAEGDSPQKHRAMMDRAEALLAVHGAASEDRLTPEERAQVEWARKGVGLCSADRAEERAEAAEAKLAKVRDLVACFRQPALTKDIDALAWAADRLDEALADPPRSE